MQNFTVLDTQVLVRMLQTSPYWTYETEQIANVLYTRIDKRFVDTHVNALKLKHKMGWFKAFRIVALVFACIGCFGLLANLAVLSLQYFYSDSFALYRIYEKYGIMRRYIAAVMIYSVTVGSITTASLFVIFWGINKFKKIGLYAVYVYSILLSLNAAAMALFMPNYLSMMITTTMSIQVMDFMRYFYYCMYGGIFVVYTALAILNIVYFYKRRKLFK